MHKELYKSAYYKPSEFSSPLGNLFILFGFLVLVGGIIFSLLFLDTPEMWWGLLISLGALILFIIIALMLRSCDKSAWLKKRQAALQLILNQSNGGYLKEKHCHVKAGPMGSYLKFIFTVKI